jgi:YHS domain-containing protein
MNGGPVGPHGPGHANCAICDAGGAPPPGASRASVLRVHARGDEFKIIQVAGNLFVCSPHNGNCCCGHPEKGRMPFENSLWSDEWERRRIRHKLHLTFSGCLGPCAVGNNALLVIYGTEVWFKDLNDTSYAPRVFDWIEEMLAAGHVTPIPESLREHVYARYVPTKDGTQALELTAPVLAGDLDGLDPVCLMSVDVGTAKHTAVHAGRTYAFCAPACKKLFLADPEAYLSGEKSVAM